MSFVRLSAAALAALSIAACAGTPETGQGPKENTGTLVGAVAGGLIGSQFGGGTGERIAAGLAGAALGGLIGNRIGAGMDDDDKRRRCRHSRPESRASAWRGRIRIPVAMDRWFRVLPMSRTGCNADLTLTPSISTVSRRSPAATLVAIRTEPGPRWGNGSAIPAEASVSHRFTPAGASLIGPRALAPSWTTQGEAPCREPR